ncbi:MAG: AAA family ATPase, partial [Bacteroidota bacterium]|nr:AAA family ATPase [Bacteroidota bacterium]
MLNLEKKQKIVAGIQAQSSNYPSQAKMAKAMGISSAQMSRILRGDIDKVLSDSNWISIARKLGVELKAEAKWNIAKTPAFNYIYAQLTACKDSSISLLLCDIADIGKTFTAKVFAREHKNTAYIDCSQVKSKQRLVRKIATEFGLDAHGKYADMYEDMVYYLKTLNNPLIILDEAGDLEYSAFLELKALWNATERSVGWYMMGADGLKAKINRNLDHKKVGYTELFSRFGGKYQKITPDGKDAQQQFFKTQVNSIGKA